MKKISISFLSLFFTLAAAAQETGAKLDVNVNTNKGAWYTSPIVWVIGAAVFILLLVALTRGGGNKN